MQTFLPYPDFYRSARCLDYRRLGKQRVEARQILNTLEGMSFGWRNHAAVRMWCGWENALIHYYNIMVQEWVARGYNNNMPLIPVGKVEMPWWLGMEELHAGYRSNLLRKDSAYYGQFGWVEGSDLDYVWVSGRDII